MGARAWEGLPACHGLPVVRVQSPQPTPPLQMEIAACRSLVTAGQWQAWGSRLSAVPTLVSLIMEGRKCEYHVVRVSVRVLAEV